MKMSEKSMDVGSEMKEVTDFWILQNKTTYIWQTPNFKEQEIASGHGGHQMENQRTQLASYQLENNSSMVTNLDTKPRIYNRAKLQAEKEEVRKRIKKSPAIAT